MKSRTQRDRATITQLWFNYKSKRGEKRVITEITTLIHYLRNDSMSMERVETFLYGKNGIETLLSENLTLRSEKYLKILYNFIERICANYVLSRQVIDLFDPYFKHHYRKKYFIFDDTDIDILKELVWVAKYIQNKRLPYVDLKDEYGLIKALLSCNDDYVHWLNEPKSVISRKIIINICSYKNAGYELMQYPECVNMSDVQELIELNNSNETALLSIVTGLINDIPPANARYGLYRFITNCVREKLCLR